MLFRRKRWDIETDLVIVGSGAAGLTAAITAHDCGIRVTLLEKADRVGGATAVSGGVVWIPNNHHMPEVGVSDSAESARRYILRLADGRSSDELIGAFIDAGPRMLRYIEEQTPLRFKAIAGYPDYHPEFDGGLAGGRSLEVALFDTHTLGDFAAKLRKSAVFGMAIMTVSEALEWKVFSRPLELPYGLLAKRYKQGLVSSGGALCGGLLRACLDRGIEPMLLTAGRELLVEDGAVLGLVAERRSTARGTSAEPAEAELRIRAHRGVLLASGGFEWSPELAARFLSGPLTHPNSPPANEGDGLRMAMAVGADLGNMSEAWWCPSVVVPGEEYDGRQLNRGDFAIRSMPHSIIVNRSGRRFVNEAHNYNDMMKAFFAFEPVAYERPNLPAWLILDQNYRDKYALLTYLPNMPIPDFVPQAGSLQELGEQLGIDSPGLLCTVLRFNEFARQGIDRDFRRGESIYDHVYGDPEHQPNPNLGVIEKPPFYALPVHVGAIGTKGGPRVNRHGQVLRVDGQPIAGLYAAGNAMAAMTGPGYPGAGSTIAAAMTFGYLAAEHAAGLCGEAGLKKTAKIG
jgi:succinate dehydrogenase/fumarate reductase flavoprotein subunit